MAKAHTTWTVLPHDPIRKLEDNLWTVEGLLPGGVPMRRVMTVARLVDGRLVLHSAVALDDAGMRELEAWGEPSFLVVPNGWHRLDARIYKDRYPELKVVGPAPHRAKIEEVVPVDTTDPDFGDPLVRYIPVRGSREGVLLVSSPGGATLVINDLVMNLRSAGSWKGWIMDAIGSTGRAPKVTPLAKFLMFKDRMAARGHLEELARTPNLTRLVFSHGEMVDSDAAEVLRRAVSVL